jgi:hypothetical protein
MKGKTNLLKEKIEELEAHFKEVKTSDYTFESPSKKEDSLTF